MIYDRLSEYYDQFIDSDLINTYIKMIQSEVKEGTVMALGCGTAPLAIELAKLDYFVSGSDLSSKMLERAYNNAVENNVHLNFYIHDILDPLTQTFDLITMTSDVINYLSNEEEVEKAIKNVAMALNEDGAYIFDFLSPQFVTKMNNYHEDILLNDDLLEWTVTKTNIPYQIKHNIRFGQEVENHLQRTFPLKKYKEILNKNGLYILKKKKTDERVILLCKKK